MFFYSLSFQPARWATLFAARSPARTFQNPSLPAGPRGKLFNFSPGAPPLFGQPASQQAARRLAGQAEANNRADRACKMDFKLLLSASRTRARLLWAWAGPARVGETVGQATRPPVAAGRQLTQFSPLFPPRRPAGRARPPMPQGIRAAQAASCASDKRRRLTRRRRRRRPNLDKIIGRPRAEVAARHLHIAAERARWPKSSFGAPPAAGQPVFVRPTRAGTFEQSGWQRRPPIIDGGAPPIDSFASAPPPPRGVNNSQRPASTRCALAGAPGRWVARLALLLGWPLKRADVT